VFLLIAVPAVAALAAYLLLLRRSVFVFAYHGVGPEQSPFPGLVIPPGDFRRHLRILRLLGPRHRTLESLLADIREGRPRRGPSFAITFDDGYRGVEAHGAAILREFGWRATVFVPTDHVGGENQWDMGRGFPRLALMGWDALERLARDGFAVGSHGKTHRSLIDLDEAEIRRELEISLRELRQRLPGCIPVFCYPFGRRHAGLIPVLQQAGYTAACSNVAGALPERGDLFDLGRLVVRGGSVPLFLWDLATYPLKSALRRALRYYRD
jgi:peptidoglycan/xylan/chitin deacetylase (PgdA/CDA1 family)